MVILSILLIGWICILSSKTFRIKWFYALITFSIVLLTLQFGFYIDSQTNYVGH